MGHGAAVSLRDGLLTLDIATDTGWSYGLLGDALPRTGLWPLPSSDPRDLLAAQINALDNTLHAALDQWQPATVVIAERFLARSLAAALSAGALDGVVRAECWRRRIRLLVQSELTVRKEVLGRGRGPTPVMKALAMAWCARMGIHAASHDAADSAVLWFWSRGEIIGQPIDPRRRTKLRSEAAQRSLPGVLGGS